MAPVKCCVPGCKANLQPQHRFPNPRKDMVRFKKWLEAINNSTLLSMESTDVYDRKKVCHSHFESCYFSTGAKRLHLNALPTLHLPTQLPSSTDTTPAGTTKLPTISTCEESDCAESNNSSCEIAATQNEEIKASTSFIKNCSVNKKKETEATSTFRRDHLEVPVMLGTPHNMLKSAGINIRKDMTPKKNRLYCMVKKLSKKLKRTSTSKDNFRRRLFEADKFAKENCLEENLSRLNAMAAQFIRCQFREANKPSRQHRFIIDEKIMALTLYKQSPKSYRFLSKIFTLPSKGTVTKFLNEINFDAGINVEIFESLKNNVQKMNSSDRFVILMWDEMSIAPSVNFNERKGCIEGFQDLGEDKLCEISDHALVFMIRGLKNKINQPVCYAFSSHGGATSLQIKKMLKQIIHMLLNIGLKPIATVSDQATPNVKALNALLKETREKYLRKSEDYRGGYFEVDDFKIYPMLYLN